MPSSENGVLKAVQSQAIKTFSSRLSFFTLRDHFIFAYEARRGPKPDTDEFKSLVGQALTRIRITRIVADAGYDSESNHSFARDEHGILTTIPAKQGRPTKKPASGRYRRQMQVRFNRPI